MDRQREQWIDVLRGMGIVLVVVGHVYGGVVFALIFLFHMPLFFCLSGYLFRPVADVSVFWRRKAVQLLLPYASFLLAIGIPLGLSIHFHTPQALPAYVLSLVLGGSQLSAWLAAFWFVTVFFVVLLLEAWLQARYPQRILLWLHGTLLALSYVISISWPALQLPWALNVVPAAAPLFYAGTLYAQWPQRQQLDGPALVLSIVAFAVVLANQLAGWQLDLVYDMKVGHYGMPFITCLAALACCITAARLAHRIATHQVRLARLLAALGQAALVIMFVHMVFTMGLASLLGEQYRLLRVVAGLSGGYLLYQASLKWRWSRALLLGSAADLQALRRRG